VAALVRTDEAAKRVEEAGARPVIGDLLDPTPTLEDAVRRARYVVHCAQPTARRERARMDGHLLGAMDPGHVARIVYVCGGSYIGRAEAGEVLDESSPPRPMGVGPTFEEGIRALRSAGERGLDYAVAFVGGVYGRRSWFTEAYLRALAGGEPILVLDPAPRWSYIHIEDCARAIELLLTAESGELAAVGREIFVVDDEPIRMDAFIEELATAAGKPPNLVRVDEATLRAKYPAILATYLSSEFPHSNGRLRKLGFVCRHPTVREGVRALGPSLRGPA
jgi:nucleoside-diphosphate-sugar epimerase